MRHGVCIAFGTEFNLPRDTHVKSLFRSVAALTLACAATLAHAGILFEIDGATSSVSTSVATDCLINCGVNVALVDNIDGQSKVLNGIGDTFTFDFFNISFYGVGGGDGSIDAQVGLASPGGGTAATGTGGFFTVFGIVNKGFLNWDYIAPTTVDGITFQLSLPNLDGFAIGTTKVQGTITLLGSQARAVSEPATLSLLGAGLLGLALVRRRRAAA